MLGLSNSPNRNGNIKAACDYTKLSEKTIRKLKIIANFSKAIPQKRPVQKMIDFMLQVQSFYDLCYYLSELIDCRNMYIDTNEKAKKLQPYDSEDDEDTESPLRLAKFRVSECLFKFVDDLLKNYED